MYGRSLPNFGYTDENGQKLSQAETVSYLGNCYRLAHQWVPEMVLNVQSDTTYV